MNRPYHHGALREALLDEGQLLLAEQGPEALSLRELARRAGVSHSAPERHFANRQALLEALAVRGHVVLQATLRRALEGTGHENRFRAAATAYVDFATQNGRLLELMFTVRSEAIASAMADLFSLTAPLVGETPGSAPTPLRLLIGATLQGIASLAATHRLSPQDVANVIDEAVAVLGPAVELRGRP